MRSVYLVLGFIFIALGFVGAFLPCSRRRRSSSSPRPALHDRLRGSKTGCSPILASGRRSSVAGERGAVPLRAKLLALAGIVTGFLMFWIGSAPGPILMASVGTFMFVGLVYVFTIPSA